MLKTGDVLKGKKALEVPVGTVLHYVHDTSFGKKKPPQLVERAQHGLRHYPSDVVVNSALDSIDHYTILWMPKETIKVGDIITNEQFKTMPPGTVVEVPMQSLLCRREGLNKNCGGPLVASSKISDIGPNGGLYTSSPKLTVKYIPEGN